MKIGLVGAELFYANGRTDVTNLMVAFRNFAERPSKKSPQYFEAVVYRLAFQPEDFCCPSVRIQIANFE